MFSIGAKRLLWPFIIWTVLDNLIIHGMQVVAENFLNQNGHMLT